MKKLMKTDQNGFSIIEILLIFVISGMLFATGWFVYSRRETSVMPSVANESPAPTISAEIEDEKTQVETASPVPEPPIDIPIDKYDVVFPQKIGGVNYLVIDDWGVKIPLSDGSSDIFIYKDESLRGYDFNDKTYRVSLSNGCFLNGFLERVKEGDPTFMDDFVHGDNVPTTNYDGVYPKINGYYYLYGYSSGKAACNELFDSNNQFIQEVIDKRAAAEAALLEDYKNISAK